MNAVQFFSMVHHDDQQDPDLPNASGDDIIGARHSQAGSNTGIGRSTHVLSRNDQIRFLVEGKLQAKSLQWYSQRSRWYNDPVSCYQQKCRFCTSNHFIFGLRWLGLIPFHVVREIVTAIEETVELLHAEVTLDQIRMYPAKAGVFVASHLTWL